MESATTRTHCFSDYEESDDEIHTPCDSFEGDIGGTRRGLVVNENTYFSTFQWKVGLRFPNGDAFKTTIAKFSITHGRKLNFIVSNKNRQQRLGQGKKFRKY